LPNQIYRFGQVLLHQSQSLRKRDRTRADIQNAGCELLDRTPLNSLTVSDICREANIAHGTFYIYFPDRQELVANLLILFVAFIQDVMRSESESQTTDPVHAATSAYFKIFEQNPGLMKCLLNHQEDFPAAKKAFQTLNHEWVTTVVQSTERILEHSGGAGDLTRDELFRRAYALGGMVDQYLSALVLNQDQTLLSVSEDQEAVINTLTHIWKRGMIE